MAISLGELAAQLGGEVVGDGQCVIRGVASLRRAGEGDISFFANASYRDALAATAASAVIISPKHRHACPVSALVAHNPYAVYARAVRLVVPEPRFAALRHPSACIDERCAIGPGCHIGAHTVIGEGSEIAADVYIGPACVIEEQCRIGAGSVLVGNCVVRRDTTIGARALIHPGAVIGSDGFGFARDGGTWIKIPQLGRVVIGDDVEIGSNTTIDRGALDDTVIEDGVKLDNQIQIAHNVRVGAHTAIAGCTGIAGSTTIGRRCAIGGGVGIVGHLQIADDVQITGMTFVTQSITEPGVYSSGTPMEPAHHWRKNYVRMKQLDEIAKKLKEIERDLHRSAGRAREQD